MARTLITVGHLVRGVRTAGSVYLGTPDQSDGYAADPRR